MSGQKETKLGGAKIPQMSAEEKFMGARGFVVVTNANPLPTGVAAYWAIVNSDAVITTYSERKANGGGSANMLNTRGLSGVTLAATMPLTPPKNNPITALEVSSGSIICYLEETI